MSPWFRPPATRAASRLRIPPIVLALALVAGLAEGQARAADFLFNSAWRGDYQTGTPANPPDPNGACGPRGVLQINNKGVCYFNKSGSAYFTALGLRDFFPGAQSPNSMLDPRAIYDPRSERFFAICSEIPLTSAGLANAQLHGYLHIAVSTSSHPVATGDWLRYRVDATEVVGSGPGEMHFGPDYPGIGVDSLALHVTANYHYLPIATGTFFHNVGILSFSKAGLLSGTAQPLTTWVGGGIGSAFTLQPVSVLWHPAGPGNVTYFAEIPFGSSATVRLWALSDPLGARTLTSVTLPVPAHGSAFDVPAPQPNTSVRLRTWSGTAQGQAQWAEGALWFVATGDTSQAAQSVDRTRIHLWKVRTNGFPAAAPALEEAGVIDAGPGTWNFQPAIGLTPAGDVAIVFTQSSASLVPRMVYAARPAGESAFEAPQVVAAGEASATYDGDYRPGISKWGDFAAVTADPADSSFWMTHEIPMTMFGGTPSWEQRWANVVPQDEHSGWPASGRVVLRGQVPAEHLSVAPDDSGGIYASWRDTRTTCGPGPCSTYDKYYAQRLLADGSLGGGWPTNGRSVDTASLAPPVLAADLEGGTWVAWLGAGTGTTPPRVLRLGRDGRPAPAWVGAHVELAAAASSIRLACDGAGNALVAFAGGGTFVQKVSPAGAPAWPAPVQVATGSYALEIVPHATDGGAYVGWVAAARVRVQRILAGGVLDPAWPAAGYDAGPGSGYVRLVPDPAGGVYVVHQRSGDLFATRLLESGTAAPGWATPVAVCTALEVQNQQVAIADGAGGLIAAWTDTRDGEEDVYATRLTPAGALAPGWAPNGVRLCAAPGIQDEPALAGDGAQGAVVSWTDRRAQPGCAGGGCGSDLYWAHVTGSGVVESQLGAEGAPLCTEVGDQSTARVVSAGPGAAIVAWLDGRNAPDGDPSFTTQVFAQRVAFDVTPPASPPVLQAQVPSCTEIALSWTAPGDDGEAGTAASYDLRCSGVPIDASNFVAAEQLATGTPRPAGAAESYVFDRGACAGPLYFALRATDDVGQSSALVTSDGPRWTPCPPPDCEAWLGAQPNAIAEGLGAPHPNPTNGGLRFELSLAAARAGARVECAIFDLVGRRVRTLQSGPGAAGRLALEWDLRDDSGARARSGYYFIRARVADRTWTRSVVVR